MPRSTVVKNQAMQRSARRGPAMGRADRGLRAMSQQRIGRMKVARMKPICREFMMGCPRLRAETVRREAERRAGVYCGDGGLRFLIVLLLLVLSEMARSSTLNTQHSTPNAQRPTPNAQRPTPNA